MNDKAKASRKTSALKRIKTFFYAASNPPLVKASLKALWHISPFAAASRSRQKTERSRWSLLQKFTYEVMSNLNRNRTISFINLGYAGLDNPHTLRLAEGDEANRYSIQLYEHLFKFCDAANADVLEVGCGRGGGAVFAFKTYHPKSYLGIDYATANIAFCNQGSPAEGLRFEVGRAESLPVPDSSKDIVVNVESSHCYTSPAAFFEEVHRVLRPGGLFLFADIRGEGIADTYQTVSMLEEQFSVLHDDMTLVARTNITENVMRALELGGEMEAEKWIQSMRDSLGRNAGSQRFVDDLFAPQARTIFSVHAPETGSNWYTRFKEGSAQYWSYVFRKNDAPH